MLYCLSLQTPSPPPHFFIPCCLRLLFRMARAHLVASSSCSWCSWCLFITNLSVPSTAQPTPLYHYSHLIAAVRRSKTIIIDNNKRTHVNDDNHRNRLLGNMLNDEKHTVIHTDTQAHRQEAHGGRGEGQLRTVTNCVSASCGSLGHKGICCFVAPGRVVPPATIILCAVKKWNRAIDRSTAYDVEELHVF